MWISRFMSALCITEETASKGTHMTIQAIEIGQAWAIGSSENNIGWCHKDLIIARIPDSQAIMHESSNVVHARKNEGVQVFGLVRTWNKATGEDKAFLVAQVWWKVGDDPNEYPAIRCLALIQPSGKTPPSNLPGLSIISISYHHNTAYYCLQ